MPSQPTAPPTPAGKPPQPDEPLRTDPTHRGFRPQRADETLRPVMSDRVDHVHRPLPPKTAEPAPQLQSPVSRGGGRYDAPGDEPIATDRRLTLQEPFPIEREWVKRLERRDVNVKEAFTIRDGSGGYYRVSVKELHSAGGLAVPYELMQRSPEPTIDITLACSVLARQRMIFVMQKATELGVTCVVPLLTDHSVPPEGLDHERANSWPGQVVRAAKQCRRGSLPQVLPPATLDSFLESAKFKAADVCVMLDDRSDPEPAQANPPSRVVLIVGPEGGVSDAERLRLAGKARPWFLGGRILRAETAVLVGLTAVHLNWGDFSDRARGE